MFTHFRSEGFVFKKEDKGEADQFFSVYAKDFGKLEILGKSIRKISSKLRGGTELFYLSEVEFVQGKTYKILTDVNLIENFTNIRRDLRKIKIAYKIAKVFDNFIKGEEKDVKIWRILKETFYHLNDLSLDAEDRKLEIIYYYFLWNLLSLLGYKPGLYNCSFCQKKLIPERLYFSSQEGGAICGSCFKKTRIGENIEVNTIKILRLLLKENRRILEKFKTEDRDRKFLRKFSDNYIFYHFELRN